MNGDLREAEKKLKEMAMKHDMGQEDCYNGIRHLAVIMLAICSDVKWVKFLLFLVLAAVIGVQGLRMVL